MNMGRISVSETRPDLGTQVDLDDIVLMIHNDEMDARIFCDAEAEDVQQVIDVLEDGECLRKFGLKDEHQEAIETLHSMLKDLLLEQK